MSDSDKKMSDIASIIEGAIKEQRLLPSWMKITATIDNKNNRVF